MLVWLVGGNTNEVGFKLVLKMLSLFSFYLSISCFSVSSRAGEIPETLMHEGQKRDNCN